MNMGKEKIEEKDVRLLRYAVEQAFDGAMRDGGIGTVEPSGRFGFGSGKS